MESQSFVKELDQFKKNLDNSGIHGALAFLNKRTPHRYTGIYRYDGDILRNIALFDSYDLNITQGENAPMSATYCSMVKEKKELIIADATQDERVKGIIITPVVSYCGVLMKDENGDAFGTLCHFDMNRCQERIYETPLLRLCVQILFDRLFKLDKSGGVTRTII